MTTLANMATCVGALVQSPLAWVPALVAVIVLVTVLVRRGRLRPVCQWEDGYDANFGYGDSEFYSVACIHPADFEVTWESFDPDLGRPVQESLLVCSAHRYDAEVELPGVIHHIRTRIL